MNTWEGLAWAFASFLALQLTMLVAIALRPSIGFDLVSLGGIAAVVYLGMSLLMLRSKTSDEDRSSDALGIRPTQLGLLLVGVGLGVALKLPAEHVAAVVEELYPTDPSELAARAARLQVEGVTQLVGFSLVVCVLGPFAEEVFFRGALFGRMASSSAVTAAVVTTLTFVAVHGYPRLWLALLLVAAPLGWLRLRSGSLLPCLGMHVTFNSAGVVLDQMGYLSMSDSFEPDLMLLAASWCAALVLLGVGHWLTQTPSAAAAREEDER